MYADPDPSRGGEGDELLVKKKITNFHEEGGGGGENWQNTQEKNEKFRSWVIAAL